MEQIKIYDANLKELGIMERKQAHAEAQWHITFHCWVVHKTKKSILFQLRSKEKQNFPNLFDISAAGHLLANEEVKDGIREVSEELGIEIPFEKLHSLGYRVEVDDETNGQLNREFQSVYIALTEKELEEFTPQVEEVAGLMWMTIPDALSFFGGTSKRAVLHGIVYNKQTDSWDNTEREVTISDFVPRIQKYYLTVAIMAERVIEGKFPVSIS